MEAIRQPGRRPARRPALGQDPIWLLVGTGIYFTLRLGFIQLRRFGHTFTVLRGDHSVRCLRHLVLQAPVPALAARVGTGNIAGVAVAITLGGPGAIFWTRSRSWAWPPVRRGHRSRGWLYATTRAVPRRPRLLHGEGLGQRWAGNDVLDLPDHRLRFCLQLSCSRTRSPAQWSAPSSSTWAASRWAATKVAVAALVVGVARFPCSPR